MNGNGKQMNKYLFIRVGTCLFTSLLGLIIVVLSLLFLSVQTEMPVLHAALSSSADGIWTTYTTPTFNLPSNTVWGGVIVDGDGNVWAGFENGYLGGIPLPIKPLISRWDGETWTTYDLPGCRVMALAAKGSNIYAGTNCPAPPTGNGGGLSWFVDGAWVNFTPTDGMAGTYISAIAPEGDTKVWVAAGYGQIYYYAINLLDHKGTASKLDDEWTIYDIPEDCFCDVRAIAIDPSGNRWFGTIGDGIWVLSHDDSEWFHYSSDVIPGAADIAFDEMGNTWVLGGYTQVARYDGSEWTYFSREEAIETHYDAIMGSINKNHIQNGEYGLWAVEGNAGVWIIPGVKEGVGFYDGHAWTYYSEDNSMLASDYVRGIAVDEQGTVWIGTEQRYSPTPNGGVSRFAPTPELALDASPNWLMVAQDDTISSIVSVSTLRGWIPTVTLTVTNLPMSTAILFNANPVTPTGQTQLIISTTLDTPVGLYPMTVMATNTEISAAATITMHVASEVYHLYFPVIFKQAGGDA